MVVNAQVNHQLHFDGINNYLTFDDIASILNESIDFTIEFTMKVIASNISLIDVLVRLVLYKRINAVTENVVLQFNETIRLYIVSVECKLKTYLKKILKR